MVHKVLFLITTSSNLAVFQNSNDCGVNAANNIMMSFDGGRRKADTSELLPRKMQEIQKLK